MTAEHPVGVFDSGVGGLSVLREIRRELPQEDLIYVADSRYAPYGEQPDDVIERRAIAIAQFLVGKSAKAIVVACNTATSLTAETLRARFSLPVVAIEPAVKPAVRQTNSAIVGVLATKPTLTSQKFARLLDAHGSRVRVLLQACPGLVEQVEKGDLTGEFTRSLVEQYVMPLVAEGADTLVLGCTHYPFLMPVIQAVAGPAVTVIDPSAAVARELRRRLLSIGLLAPGDRLGRDAFWTSGSLETVQPVIARLWRNEANVQSVPLEFLT